MNYEEKYREAIKAVEELREANPNDEGINEWVKDHFLELINKDEAIRIQIIDHIEWSLENMLISSEEKERWIAWLEKHSEKKDILEDATLDNNEDGLITDTIKARGKQKPVGKPTLDVEIPFGMDSELVEEAMTIPKGCYAVIEDHKVVIRKGEKPAEWSEEDEAFYQRLEQIVCKVDIEAFQGDVDLHGWLKSLRPQSHWKPTDEQIKVLNEVINFAADHGTMRWNDYIYNVLKSLREQLKNL